MSGFNPHTTVGALEGGIILANLLFGLLTMQVDIYYRRFPHDQWPLKILVAVVWLLELAHTVCIMYGLYLVTIRLHGQNLDGIPESLRVAFFFSGTVGPIVQAFFATRVAKCFDKPYLAIVCWTATFLRFLTSLMLTAICLNIPTMAQFEARWQWVLTTDLVVEASVDLLIATSMCYYLLKSRRHSVYKSTIRLLDRLIGITISTGLITSLVAIIMVICFLTMPNNFLWLALMICQAELFSNSMLASLNGRSIMRRDRDHDAEISGISKSKLTLNHDSVELTTHINVGLFPTDGEWNVERVSTPTTLV